MHDEAVLFEFRSAPPGSFDLDPDRQIMLSQPGDRFILTTAAALDYIDAEIVTVGTAVDAEPERLSWWQRLKTRAIALITDLLHHSPAVR